MRTLLLVGTRKGLFILESGDERKSWSIRGPLCEGWPVYHAVFEPGAGAIYAAATSEWHGAAVWRSDDLGSTWSHSSNGLEYAAGGRKVSKISSLAATRGRVLAGVEAPGIFTSSDDGESWSLLSTLAGQPGSEEWDDPANQPPGHLGLSALMLDGDDDARFWAIVQGIGLFETHDGGSSWEPRNRGLRADWPREHEDVGFCVHKLTRSPSDPNRMYQQNHCGMHRSDDAGKTWQEITEGLPTDFGFAAGAHPHDRDTFYVVPLDPGHGRFMPDGRVSVWRTRDGGASWTQLENGLPSQDAYVGVLREGMAIDTEDVPGLYVGTSTGQLFASADEGESWSTIAGYLPPIWSVEVAKVE